MATSSIGQAVVLDNEGAERLFKIIDKPYKPAKTRSGRKRKLSMRKLNPKDFEQKMLASLEIKPLREVLSEGFSKSCLRKAFSRYVCERDRDVARFLNVG